MAVNRTHDQGRTTTDAYAEAHRPVPAGLPGDVRVEPDEPREANQVEVFREVPDDLRREKCGAHPMEAVRIVHANPEAHDRSPNAGRT
jgi:hypothetical protein